ncbi:PAS domain S-box-containing protein [Sinorhizobium fredii]
MATPSACLAITISPRIDFDLASETSLESNHVSFAKRSDSNHIIAALSKSQAIIQFDLTGNILTANENFCKALGYGLYEIVGQHHRIFCPADYAATPEYREFWARLGRGEFDSNAYKRVTKGGREIWIQATYNPVFRNGRPYKVVKFATDITAAKLKATEDAGKLDAISRSQAVIEFTPAGEIITANENFCSALGYRLSEIETRHHSMFCEPNYARTADYSDFWRRLAQGEFIAGEFVRYGKGGKEIWIQAAYNPIRDPNGKVYKVVKFATDVSERMAAINTLGAGLRSLAEGDLTRTLDTPFVPSMEAVRLPASMSATASRLSDKRAPHWSRSSSRFRTSTSTSRRSSKRRGNRRRASGRSISRSTRWIRRHSRTPPWSRKAPRQATPCRARQRLSTAFFGNSASVRNSTAVRPNCAPMRPLHRPGPIMQRRPEAPRSETSRSCRRRLTEFLSAPPKPRA